MSRSHLSLGLLALVTIVMLQVTPVYAQDGERAAGGMNALQQGQNGVRPPVNNMPDNVVQTDRAIEQTTPQGEAIQSVTLTPVVPELSVPIPGVEFTTPTVENGVISVPFLAQYINGVYRYFLGIITVITIIMVIYGGFHYLVGATTGSVMKGKQLITDAIMGLALAFCSYFILYTINPKLVQLNALSLPYVSSLALEIDEALPHMEEVAVNGPGGESCGAQSSCPPIVLVSVKELLNEVGETNPGLAAEYTRKIHGCEGPEFRGGGTATCRGSLERTMNTSMKPKFLQLFQSLPAGGGKIKIGEISRRKQTQFYGFFPLRVPCGPLLSGFPAVQNICGAGGHGNGTAVDIWFIPSGGGSNNCADVTPGKPWPVFMSEIGWTHLCHEDWHYEPSENHPNARRSNTWRNLPCIGTANDSLLRICGNR